MTTTTIDTAAATIFAEVFAAGDFAFEVGPRMTCTEVDALAGILRAVGADAAAATWLEGHSIEDEEGDAHFTPKID
jgi:hypothetical protein